MRFLFSNFSKEHERARQKTCLFMMFLVFGGGLLGLWSCADIRYDLAVKVISDPCGFYKGTYNSNEEFLGEGSKNKPYYICEPEQLRLIGNTATKPDYSLAKHYALGRDIRLPDDAAVETIGAACNARKKK